MIQTIQKLAPIVAPLIILAMWFALVLLGQVEPQPFITALTAALGGIGGHTVGVKRGTGS